MAGLTLAFAALLGFIAVSVLRPAKAPCGCQDQEVPGAS